MVEESEFGVWLGICKAENWRARTLFAKSAKCAKMQFDSAQICSPTLFLPPLAPFSLASCQPHLDNLRNPYKALSTQGTRYQHTMDGILAPTTETLPHSVAGVVDPFAVNSD